MTMARMLNDTMATSFEAVLLIRIEIRLKIGKLAWHKKAGLAGRLPLHQIRTLHPSIGVSLLLWRGKNHAMSQTMPRFAKIT